MAFGDGAHRWCNGYKGGAFMNAISALIKENSGSSLARHENRVKSLLSMSQEVIPSHTSNLLEPGS